MYGLARDAHGAGGMNTNTLRLPRLLSTVLAGGSLVLGGCSMSLECTAADCSSALTVQLDHSSDLSEGALELDVITADRTVRCSVGPALTAERQSCSGATDAEVAWDGSTITVSLREDSASEPVTSVEVVVSRDGSELARETLDVDPGEPITPNGPGCEPVCWTGTASTSI